MRKTIMITLDAEPNTMRNRLIRLIENWATIETLYKMKTDKQMLLHIVNVMFKGLGVKAV